MNKQFLKGLVTKVNDDYTLEVAVASTANKDRQGEIIEPSAWRLDNFKRNPVLQWAHDYRNIPIGKVEQISVEGDKLIFKPRFAAHIDEFAKKVWQMFKEGYLNAFSVGFQPLEPIKDGVYTDVELLEISAVPVPANPYALVVARSLGIELEDVHLKPEPELIGEYIHVRVRDPKLFIQDSFRTIDISVDEGIKSVIGKLLSDPNGSTVIQKFLFDAERWTLEDAADWVAQHEASAAETAAEQAAEEKGVVRFEATKPIDREWDGNAATQRLRSWAGGDENMDWAQFKRGFGWYDSAEPELIGSYKLPHHDIVDGDLAVNLRGVVAAMVVLLGGRGGVDVPENDRRGIYAHLSSHYGQFEQEPPEFKTYTAEEADKLGDTVLAKHAEHRILTFEEKAKIETALDTLKLTADALTDVLKNTTVKDNDGTHTAGSDSGGANALRIVHRALKQADRQIELANRTIKIKLTNPNT